MAALVTASCTSTITFGFAGGGGFVYVGEMGGGVRCGSGTLRLTASGDEVEGEWAEGEWAESEWVERGWVEVLALSESNLSHHGTATYVRSITSRRTWAQ